MAEIEIKRTNFFDGQFLKQDEFIDLDLYHQHLRRRWAFVLFKQSGIVQTSPDDLQVVVPNALNKLIVVKAGMAIGKRNDLKEAREVILREDTLPIDLTVGSISVPTPLVGGTGFVTVHYVEEPVAIPPSEGDVPGNTRIREHARITVHNALPGATAPNGEPYIRLGDVTFATMVPDPSPRQRAFLNADLLAATPTLGVSPNQVTAGVSVALTVTSTGLSLLGLTPAGVTVSGSGVTVSNVVVVNASTATVTVAVAVNAAAGARTLTIGGVPASLTVQAGLNVTGFTPVGIGAANEFLRIDGTGFAAGQSATVFFSGPGSPPPNLPVNVAGINVTAVQISIPLAEFLAGGQAAQAVVGPVTVTTGGNTVTSAGNVTPPPTVPVLSSTSLAQGSLLTLTGQRFAGATEVGFGGRTRTPAGTIPPGDTLGAFPNTVTPFNELVSNTQISVRVPPGSTSGQVVTVKTPGGTVASTQTLTVS